MPAYKTLQCTGLFTPFHRIIERNFFSFCSSRRLFTNDSPHHSKGASEFPNVKIIPDNLVFFGSEGMANFSVNPATFTKGEDGVFRCNNGGLAATFLPAMASGSLKKYDWSQRIHLRLRASEALMIGATPKLIVGRLKVEPVKDDSVLLTASPFEYELAKGPVKVLLHLQQFRGIETFITHSLDLMLGLQVARDPRLLNHFLKHESSATYGKVVPSLFEDDAGDVSFDATSKQAF